MTRLRSCQRGFTLLEMMIVLIIIGLVIGMVAPLLGRVLDSTRESATVNRTGQIEDAIVVFLRKNGHLPCPGAPNATTLGDERASCSSGTTNDGIVPFRTLGLAEDVAKDGYSRFMTYHVDAAYASGSLPIDTGFCTVSSSLNVVDGSGTAVTNLVTNPIAYVLVSHGENGSGYYYPPGTARINAPAGSTYEGENADSDAIFVDTGTIASSGGGASGPYDDSVIWATRDQLGAKVQEFGCP